VPTCPYHNKPTPCPDCQQRNMGAFAGQGRYMGSAAPAVETMGSQPRPDDHDDHGTARPCSLRCGAGEGIYVLNTEADVYCIYTDSLLGCAQVILRNGTATFTCHIITNAVFPLIFVRSAILRFESRYGPITACYVICAADNPALGTRIGRWLGQHIPVKRITGTDGCAIEIATGQVGPVPGHWNVGCDDIAGWLTAPDLIDLRIIGPNTIGEPGVGDYSEICNVCRDL
jgi:hypothetical protein